jgi:hypothetical protein
MIRLQLAQHVVDRLPQLRIEVGVLSELPQNPGRRRGS